jgi:DNA-binding MarR family transcriptional regulator
MLLDLTAARLEGKLTPVSSLCIAAAVPTTTALRWIRSLSDAGIIERRPDPFDARRSYVQLSDAAAEAMFGWLRLFADQFGER